LPSTTSTSDAAAFLAAARTTVDAVLARYGRDVARTGRVGEAIAYALGTPGKRLRPGLFLAAFREAGGRGDAGEAAAAVEVVHTYSLVHDDLPCMDDDDLRRGRPTVHRVFDVETATEAGYRMVRLGALGRVLFAAAGPDGMIGGQVLDLEAEGRTLDQHEVSALHRAKTGALIAASAELGAVAAGAGGETRAAMRAYGEALGLAFQIVDDVLDATASSTALGKTAGKDVRQGKATFLGVSSPGEARAAAARHAAAAMDRLGEIGLHSTLLGGIADFIVHRRS
jgi:geranylgeranyl pyrophosphate synthase